MSADPAGPSPAPILNDREAAPYARLRRTALLAAIGPGVAALLCTLLIGPVTLTEAFFREQDLPVLPLACLALYLLAAWAPRSGVWRRLTDGLEARPALFAGCAASLVAVISGAGVFLVFDNHPLSVDEFMATFDAAILKRGALLAPVAQAWRPFVTAMQPIYALDVAHQAAWSSSYYPINAAFRALLDLIGLQCLTGALWTALSVLLTFHIGRRLWPERPAAAVTAAVLLATSQQLLLTGMTPYAMPAHLALNLLWLSLFLRPGWASQVAALGVGFAACGLHQLIFHPLFVIPFVGQLWIERRWRRALFYTAGYLAVGLFWAAYWKLALSTVHLPATASLQRGPNYLLDTALSLLKRLDLQAIKWTVENLFRLVVWQNPLTVGLALIGAPVAWRAGGTPRALLVGVGLTFGVVAVLQPYQGHGWGFRYAHGLLGSLCLLAGFGWMELWGGCDVQQRRRGVAAVAVASLFALLVLLPVRAFQANRFTAPYARAERLIQAQDADVVLVNSSRLLFADDLVRNDPWLERRPRVMSVLAMNDALVRQVCSRFKVAVFDKETGRAVGLRVLTGGPATANGILDQLLKAGRCGAAIRPGS